MNTDVFLLAHTVAPSTRRQYARSVARFLAWAALSVAGLEAALLVDEARAVRLLDKALSLYGHALYLDEKGLCRNRLAQAIHGLVALHFPQLRGKLPQSTSALRGWSRLQPAATKLPLLRFGTWAAAQSMFIAGDMVEAAAVIAAFGAYLRVGEAAAVLVQHAHFNQDAVVPGFTVKHAKSGPNQFAHCTDQRAARLVRLWKLYRLSACRARPNEPLFPTTPAKLNAALTAALERLGVTKKFSFHSLRHGAASQARLDGETVENIRLAGRWAQTATALHYIKASLVFGNMTLLPTDVEILGSNLHRGEQLIRLFKETLF